MSQRIRGQEITMRIAVDNRIRTGSFFKVTEFTSTPRTDLVEESFLGELEDDIDIQHHGYDLSWTVQNQDEKTLEFLQEIISAEQNAQKHPDITITVIHQYRETGARNQVEVYHDVFVKVSDNGFGGRKEYVTTGFEAKCKRKSLLPA